MTSHIFAPDIGGAAGGSKYASQVQKTLTLYITRQDQQVHFTYDKSLVDVTLIRSSVELVGEPGRGASGSAQVGRGYTSGITPGYSSSVNELYALNQTGSSTVLGSTQSNSVSHRPDLNHGWVDVKIAGMTDGPHFMTDSEASEGELTLFLPTDSGLISSRAIQQAGASNPIRMARVKMNERVTVHTDFGGSAPRFQRIARFAEDFADTDPATYRNADGSIKYYVASGTYPCQIPSNMISCMVLHFEITSTKTL